MIKLNDKYDIRELANFGFTPFKANRNCKNYYRIFPNQDDLMILVNNEDRELIVCQYFEGDLRVHKNPRIRMRDRTRVENVLVQLATDGVIHNG